MDAHLFFACRQSQSPHIRCGRLADTAVRSDSSADYPDKNSFSGQIYSIWCNAAVCCQTNGHGIFHYLFVQHRKGTRHTGTDRAGVCIWCSSELRGTAAENFCFGCKLYMHFQSDDCFILLYSSLLLLPTPDSAGCADTARVCSKLYAALNDLFLLKTVSDQLQTDRQSLDSPYRTEGKFPEVPQGSRKLYKYRPDTS